MLRNSGVVMYAWPFNMGSTISHVPAAHGQMRIQVITQRLPGASDGKCLLGHLYVLGRGPADGPITPPSLRRHDPVDEAGHDSALYADVG